MFEFGGARGRLNFVRGICDVYYPRRYEFWKIVSE
jgi:hypothetical protein